MKSAMYFEETQALMQTFSQEDQAYFQDLWDYFNFAGFLYEEKALREQVYNLALDFSQAGADGLTAKDYFWSRSKGNGRPNHRKYAQRIDAVCFEIWGYLFRYCDILSPLK